MSIRLTPEVEALIRQKVDSGHYASPDEVIQAAIRLLDERDQRLQHLRALLAVGSEQERRGELIDFTPELLDEIDREVEERFQRGEQPSLDGCP